MCVALRTPSATSPNPEPSTIATRGARGPSVRETVSVAARRVLLPSPFSPLIAGFPPASPTGSWRASPRSWRGSRAGRDRACGRGPERRCPRSESHRADVGEAAQGERRDRSEEHTSELQSLTNLVCRLLLEKKKKK